MDSRKAVLATGVSQNPRPNAPDSGALCGFSAAIGIPFDLI
jgi:hypothetical protein